MTTDQKIIDLLTEIKNILRELSMDWHTEKGYDMRETFKENQ